MNNTEIQKIFDAKYNRSDWVRLIHDVFKGKETFLSKPQEISVEKSIAEKVYYLGVVTLENAHKIAIYEVKLSNHVNIERNRAGIRNLLCPTWRGLGFVGAFMLCHRDSESVLRFSYVSESFRFDENGKYSKDSTDPKRFTYLLGEGHRSKTAVQQFVTLKNSDLTLQDVTKAFSVEALSKRFFNEYKEKYEDIVEYVTGKRVVKSGGKWEMKTTGVPNKKIMTAFSAFSDPEKAVRDYVKKLMGRLVFIQFLQKKGWMGVPANDSAWKNGDKDFVQNLFKNTKNKDSFIDDVLEPLFEDLNTKRENDLVSSEMVGKNIKVPYLNGGLFEKDAQDNTEFPLPKKFMEDLLEFFTQYNFTIDENDPDDAEVGVDPEMLSCIFENLLEDNKEKGAFYTPKEIVQYMCRESLIAHLCNGVKKNETKDRIRDFVLTHKADVLNGAEDISEQVDEKLKNVRICDPAIGSGAFPMGLMRELYFCRSAIEGFDHAKAAEIKKHIIQQNIYGVDIEKGAVDIARLRFWLSLIVDEETPHALPNLDFKIMQGNSLLEQYEGVDLSDITYKTSKKEMKVGYDLFDSNLTKSKQLISFLKDKFFDCEDHETKRQIRDALKSEIQALLLEKGCDIKLDAIRDVTATDQFFLWHTWFSEVFEQGGFDIVIGNPPYISAPTQIATPQLAIQRERLAKSKKYRSLYQKWDLYIPFIELGLQLCAKGGVCDMIVPYPLTNQLYAKMLRKMIVEEYDIFELADLNGTKIFENATVSNCIPFIKKAKPQNKTWISNVNDDLVIAKSFEQPLENLVQDKKNYVWNVTQERRETNRHAGMRVLGDFCYISKGMVLNADEKIAKGKFKKDDLISEFKDGIHCRKFIESKDITSYAVHRVRYLEYDTKRVPENISRPTFRALYTTPKLMFNRLGNLQVIFDEEGDFTTSDAMFVSLLWKDLHGVENKSIASSIKKFSALSRSQMENLSKEVNLRYLLGVMNSRYASVLLTDLRGGDYHIYPEHIRNIPIPSATKEQQQPIIDLVDKILAAKKANPQADTTDLEKQIDQLVYKLYNLTPDEIAVIEGSNNV